MNATEARTEVFAGNPDAWTVRARIQSTMAAAIKSGTGAVVEVTIISGGRISVCGVDADVIAAREVMTAAGCVLTATETDDEFPGERFDFWVHA